LIGQGLAGLALFQWSGLMYVALFGLFAAALWIVGVQLTRRQINRAAEDLVFNLEYPAIVKKYQDLEKLGRLKEAEQEIKKGIRLYSRTDHAYFHYHEFLLRQKREAEATKVLMRLHDKIYSSRDVHEHVKGHVILRIAGDFSRRGDAVGAEHTLKKAIDDDLPFFHLWLHYAALARDRGDGAACIARLEAAAERFPEQPEIAVQLARDLYAAGEHAAADTVLEAAMLRFETQIGIFIQWARSAHERQDWPEAARRWGELQERFVLNAEVFEKGAEALRAIGEAAEAERVMAGHPGMRAVPWPLV